MCAGMRVDTCEGMRRDERARAKTCVPRCVRTCEETYVSTCGCTCVWTCAHACKRHVSAHMHAHECACTCVQVDTEPCGCQTGECCSVWTDCSQMAALAALICRKCCLTVFSMLARWIALLAHAPHRHKPQPDLIPAGLLAQSITPFAYYYRLEQPRPLPGQHGSPSVYLTVRERSG